VAVPASLVAVVVAVVVATAGSTVVAVAAPPSSSHPPVSNSGPVVRVLLIGDSTATTLGEGLGEASVEHRYRDVLTDDGILGCGVAIGPEVEIMGVRAEPAPICRGAPPAPGTPPDEQSLDNAWRHDMAVNHPNVVALLAGRWEVVDREYRGTWTNILHPAFAAYVKRQLEKASDLVTSAGPHIVFLTAPCTDEGEQPNGAPWPEENPARLAEYNKLVRQVAAEHPQTDSVADLNAAACPGGHYTTTLDGVTVRTVSDGIHFTPAGGVVLAPSVSRGHEVWGVAALGIGGAQTSYEGSCPVKISTRRASARFPISLTSSSVKTPLALRAVTSSSSNASDSTPRLRSSATSPDPFASSLALSFITAA
jgi:hypothetical protein